MKYINVDISINNQKHASKCSCLIYRHQIAYLYIFRKIDNYIILQFISY